MVNELNEFGESVCGREPDVILLWLLLWMVMFGMAYIVLEFWDYMFNKFFGEQNPKMPKDGEVVPSMLECVHSLPLSLCVVCRGKYATTDSEGE